VEPAIDILSLDLGTKTGYALGRRDPEIGTWTLATEKELRDQKKLRFDRRLDCRIGRLYDYVVGAIRLFSPRFIVFEDVQFSSYTAQTQLWASLRAAVWLASWTHPDTFLDCVPVTTLKLFTTGHGGANKDRMARSLVSAMPERLGWKMQAVWDRRTEELLDDNAVDALAIWRWAQHHLGRTP
jgi:Holliday junction resolvasome RuvABC endonuclease subunit